MFAGDEFYGDEITSGVTRPADQPAPTIAELGAWLDEGGCETPDGCWVEPDGTCEHGLSSWLIALGMI